MVTKIIYKQFFKGGYHRFFSSRVDFSEYDLIMMVWTFGQLFGRFLPTGVTGGLPGGSVKIIGVNFYFYLALNFLNPLI